MHEPSYGEIVARMLFGAVMGAALASPAFFFLDAPLWSIYLVGLVVGLLSRQG